MPGNRIRIGQIHRSFLLALAVLALTSSPAGARSRRAVPNLGGTAWLLQGVFISKDTGPIFVRRTVDRLTFMIDFLDDGTFVERGVTRDYVMTGVWSQRKKRIVLDYDQATIRSLERGSEEDLIGVRVGLNEVRNAHYEIRRLKVRLKMRLGKDGDIRLTFVQKQTALYQYQLGNLRLWSRVYRESFRGKAAGVAIDPAVEPVLSRLEAPERVESSCNGAFRVGSGASQPITGSMTTVNEGPGPVSPINGLQATSISVFQDLSFGRERVIQTLRSYTYLDGEGRLWELGGQDPDGTDWWWKDEIDYSSIGAGVVKGRVLVFDPSMTTDAAAGTRYSGISAVGADGVVTKKIGSGSIWIDGTDVVYTGLGRLEVYRVEQRIDVLDVETGVRTTTERTSWWRPDLGTIQLSALVTVREGLDRVTVAAVACKVNLPRAVPDPP